MFKMTTLGLVVALGGAGAARATMLPVPAGLADGALVQVAESCGPGGFRSGLDGACHPLGPYRHGWAGHRCPAGRHVGLEGTACWPNR